MCWYCNKNIEGRLHVRSSIQMDIKSNEQKREKGQIGWSILQPKVPSKYRVTIFRVARIANRETPVQLF